MTYSVSHAFLPSLSLQQKKLAEYAAYDTYKKIISIGQKHGENEEKKKKEERSYLFSIRGKLQY